MYNIRMNERSKIAVSTGGSARLEGVATSWAVPFRTCHDAHGPPLDISNRSYTSQTCVKGLENVLHHITRR